MKGIHVTFIKVSRPSTHLPTVRLSVCFISFHHFLLHILLTLPSVPPSPSSLHRPIFPPLPLPLLVHWPCKGPGTGGRGDALATRA